jgi:hypothetical protein
VKRHKSERAMRQEMGSVALSVIGHVLGVSAWFMIA